MQEYIAFALTIVLILAFLPQMVVQQRNHLTIMQAEAVIEVAKEKAAQDGMFTDDICREIETELHGLLSPGASVDFAGTNRSVVKYRPSIGGSVTDANIISYEIGVPINSIIANNSLFGISDADNSYVYWFKGTIMSERLR